MEAARAGKPSKQEVLAWESRWGKPVAYASIACALAALAYALLAGILGTPGPLTSQSPPEALVDWHEMGGETAVIRILQVINGLLLIPAFFFLFRAIDARAENFRSSMRPFVFLGPAFIAIQAVLIWFADRGAAADFVNGGYPLTGDAAEDAVDKVVSASDLVSIANLAVVPALLGLVAAGVYFSSQAMRAGLLSRFWGTFGMAVAAGALFLGTIGMSVWVLYVGFIAARWVRPPPAWDAVEAIPWPVGGMRPDAGDGNAIDVGGREVGSGDDAAEGVGDPHNPPLPQRQGNPGDTLGPEPQKRKRRN